FCHALDDTAESCLRYKGPAQSPHYCLCSKGYLLCRCIHPTGARRSRSRDWPVRVHTLFPYLAVHSVY
ncbi:hypothetical protein SERLA73DRAFT_183481, partial [Serpula lacrymans var. lacrymans S7.3]